MKIAFINPPAADVHLFGQKANFESPLGLAMLAAYVRQHGHEPVIIDSAAEELSEEQTVERVARLGAQVVGITANTVMMPPATKMAVLLQKHVPDTLVVLGGKHVSVIPEDVHTGTDVPFDVSVVNEGEETLLEIIQTLERCGCKKAFLSDPATREQIKGIVFTHEGKPRQTPARPFIKDLDSLPFPARELLPLHIYQPAGHRHKRLPAFSMVAIRGCPYPCTFCSEARTTVRFSSPQRVVAEIEHLVQQFGAKEITFWDDTMTLNKKWMYELCDLLAAKKLDIVWSCFAAINTITLDLLARMKAAGCWNIFYGIEAADDRVQKHIRIQKFGSVDHVKQVIRQTQAAGIEVRAAFMVGLPGETPDAAMATLKMAKELEPDYAQWNYTVPYPGTQLWKDMRNHGRLLARDWGQFSNWYPSYLPFAYSDPEELVRIRKQILRKFYLRPRYVWGRLTHMRDIHDAKRYAGALFDFLGVLGRARKGRPAPVAFGSRAIEGALQA